MKCCVTGHTRGLGKSLYNYFTSLGWEVIGFNSQTDFNSIVKESHGCDLFVNNSYANGKQIDFLNQLCDSVKKMIVCGSVVSDFSDPILPEYSLHKKQLEQRFLELADESQANMLLHKLSSDAYNNVDLVIRTIEFWLENPEIKVVTYVATQEPNR